MSWIDYYGILVCLWIIFCFLMVFLKKTRLLGLSFSFSSVVLFIGLTGLENYYGFDQTNPSSYKENKKEKFFEALQSGEEVSLNLVPSSWLQYKDGRGSDSIIPLNILLNESDVMLTSNPGFKTDK